MKKLSEGVINSSAVWFIHFQKQFIESHGQLCLPRCQGSGFTFTAYWTGRPKVTILSYSFSEGKKLYTVSVRRFPESFCHLFKVSYQNQHSIPLIKIITELMN